MGYMDQALELAERGRGQTSPNPLVGAVVVSPAEVVVGAGFHMRAGEDHAEVLALREAGQRARGATLYCTLEPCCHQGRTGPCVTRIVAAGVERVVVAMVDPNPRVSGSGITYLRSHGIHVDIGVCEEAAERLNEAFVTWVTRGRPFVTMKIAASLDRCVAAGLGERTQLTSELATRAVHQLRGQVDAVGVGSKTVLVDDPVLTARGVTRGRPLTRVVFDRRLRTPPSARLFTTLAEGPVVVLTSEHALEVHADRAERLRAAGARLEPLAAGRMSEAMACLGALEISSLLLEGGPTVHRAAWSGGVVDRVQIFIAPAALGAGGVAWLSDGSLSVADLENVRVRSYGPDVLIEGDVYRTH